MNRATPNRKIRHTVSTILIAAIAIYNVIDTARKIDIAAPSHIGRDNVSVYVQRFDSIRDTVNLFREIGYVDDAAFNAGWFQAQYALAPTILVQGIEQVLVVANFHRDTSENKSMVERELELLYDYGNGVRLYRGRKP